MRVRLCYVHPAAHVFNLSTPRHGDRYMPLVIAPLSAISRPGQFHAAHLATRPRGVD
jgi:hypothetical protein